jgi:hypothetical protein
VTRKLSPARVSRPGYPTLATARRLLRGAALAGGLLACGGALADITPPEHGRGESHGTIPRMKGQTVRPTPPLPGGMPRPQPQILPQPPHSPQPPQPPQPPTPTIKRTQTQTVDDDLVLDLTQEGLNRYVDRVLEVSDDESASPPVRVRIEPAPLHPKKSRGAQ